MKDDVEEQMVKIRSVITPVSLVVTAFAPVEKCWQDLDSCAEEGGKGGSVLVFVDLALC